MGFLNRKKILIVGALNKKSIAYGAAEALHNQGADLAFTYQTHSLKYRLERITVHFSNCPLIKCDVSCDEDIDNVFTVLSDNWGHLDGIVHSIAYAPADQLRGDFISSINREGFSIAHNISAYSFAAFAKYGRKLMQNRSASLVTLTYLGAEFAMPNYNTMGPAKASLESVVRYTAFSLGPSGIRANAVSAGPILTASAAGIRDFKKILDYNEQASPLKRNVTLEQIGNTVAFLISDLSSGITGEVVHVDSGYHASRMVGLN